MSDCNIGFTDPEITVEGENEGVGGSITVPPNSASYGQGDSESSSSMEAFFNHERGSISHSQVKCSLYEVFVDIDEPSLTLHSSFVEAIKRIDLAVTEAEKNVAMKEFISKFGTHYAKNTVMGIGVDFETRYTEEETSS